jgi:peptidoglycan/xylan/chitin deacetylase (PgdA/CDA1 family)
MNVRISDVFRPFLGKKLIWRKDSSEKVIYLTFDDGPVPEVTPFVLDILDQFNLKATFFCEGENVQRYPELYKQIVSLGHKTGNHTFNHLNGFKETTDEYIYNIDKASEYIDSSLMRPPYGRITHRQKQLIQSRFQIIMWDLLTRDYNRKLTPEFILNNIKRHSRNGSIVVFHDSIKAKDNMLAALPLAIEFWKNEGYGFGLL